MVHGVFDFESCFLYEVSRVRAELYFHGNIKMFSTNSNAIVAICPERVHPKGVYAVIDPTSWIP